MVRRRLKPLDVDGFYPRTAGSVAQVYEEAVENGPVRQRVDLDRSVVPVAHPAAHAQPPRFVGRAGAKADALHPPRDDGAKARHDLFSLAVSLCGRAERVA